MPASLNETLNELNDLCRFFTDAERRLKDGQIVDMKDIEARVAAVCQTVQNAVPEQQKEFLPEMTVLVNLLNVYEKTLRDTYGKAIEKEPDKEQGHGGD